jgi:CubicO group peptidase (beta-lactamase class C family)
LALALAALVLASCSAATCTLLRRYVTWGPSSIEDFRRFPARSIARADAPFRYPNDPASADRYAPLLQEVTYRHDGRARTVALDALLADTGTTAFIVIKDGAIVRESYFNGYARDSMNRAFSATKSFTAALVGVALSEGRIHDLDDPFVRYLPELRGRRYDEITIRQLLLMSAGFSYTYGPFPWTDNTRLYYHPDARRVILDGPPVEAPPGRTFRYNNYSPTILAMILERVAGETVSRYFERSIWKPIGAEYDATWSLDHEGTGLESTPSGLNARAIDLVKLGTLYLNGGRWGERQIFTTNWAEESVTPLPAELPGHSDDDVANGVYYKFGWWGHALGVGRYCFYANGHLGQFIYVCPEKQLIVARFGKELGSVGREWPMVLRAIAEAIH